MGVFSELKPKNDVRRNPFDLSCFSTYNTKCGLALPLKFWPTLPNSEYELDLKALMRTQPLHTAAFAGFTFNYDVVWTPNNDHYSSFNQFIAQRLNKQHATQPDINQIPNFKLVPFVENLIAMGVWDTLASELSPVEMIRYHDDQDYQITCPRFFFYSEHLPEESMVLSCFRTLDLLEYGNYLGLLKQVVNAVKYWLDNHCQYVSGQEKWPYLFRFLGWMQGQGSSQVADLQGLTFSGNDSTLVGDIGYTVTLGPQTTIMKSVFGHNLDYFLNSSDVCVDLWSVMCYNKAWWQFYRNEYYDEKYVHFGISTNGQYFKYEIDYVYMFNMDDISATITPSIGSLNSTDLRLISMFAIKPHQYKKDLFTGNLPSTQYGSVSVASADDVFAKLIGNNINVSSPSVPYTPNTDNAQVYTNKALPSTSALMGQAFNPSDVVSGIRSDKFKFDPAPMINMLELRRADSLQRFRERMLRAGNRTKDIFQAHGWESPMSEKAFEAEFYGSFDGRLNLNVVAATNDSPDVNLGQLAANGVGAIGGSKIRFKSHDFGTLLIIAYITKDAVYDAYGIHKSHTLLEAWDFPYPELQNVSLAPVVKENLFNTSSANTDVLGYLPQNMAYKTANDLTHGEFFTVPFADVTDVQHLSRMKETDMMPMGIFSNMVTARMDIGKPKTLAFYYIQPSCADNIFTQLASPLQDSDQFFGNVHFDLKCVQPLDVIGLPI